MIPDGIFQWGMHSAIISTVLAIVAFGFGKFSGKPQWVHLLWLMVFMKLLVPPIVHIPLPVPAGFMNTIQYAFQSTESEKDLQASQALSSPVVVIDRATNSSLSHLITGKSSSQLTSQITSLKQVFMILWGAGIIGVMLWTVLRVWKFESLLRQNCRPMRGIHMTEAEKIARKLGLKKLPELMSCQASVSPMVWWCGGKIKIIIPSSLIQSLSMEELKWVMAHELAHVKRRDYLIRWVEWMGCTLFWWNPIVWWAQHQLKVSEELCCDATVVKSLSARPHHYARCLLKAIEFLARPGIRPPAMASAVNSGGGLEKRFNMIISHQKNKIQARFAQVVTLIIGLAVMPLGFTYAQDFKSIEKRLSQAVKKGEITKDQAESMMQALKHSSPSKVTKKKIAVPPSQKNPMDNASARFEMELKQKFKAIHAEESKSYERKLMAEVKNGNLTPDQAQDKIVSFQKALEVELQSEALRHNLNFQRQTLEQAVKAGKISKKEAHAKMESLEKEHKEHHKKIKAAKAQNNEVNLKVKTDFNANESHRKIEHSEKGKKEVRVITKRKSSSAHLSPELERLKDELAHEIEIGEITEQQAKSIFEKRSQKIQDSNHQSHFENNQKGDLEKALFEIIAAVEAGKMSQKEGERKLHSIIKGANKDVDIEIDIKKNSNYDSNEKVRKSNDELLDVEVEVDIEN